MTKLKRKLTLPLLVILLAGLGAACHKQAATAPVPGQINSFDAYAYRVLADAQAALNDFRNSITSGKVVETPTLKTIFNQASTDYNAANAVYQAWHAAGGVEPTTSLSNALNKLSSDIAAFPATAGGK